MHYHITTLPHYHITTLPHYHINPIITAQIIIEWRNDQFHVPAALLPAVVKWLHSALEPHVTWPIQYYQPHVCQSCYMSCSSHGSWCDAPTTAYVARIKSYNATFCVIFSSALLRPPIRHSGTAVGCICRQPVYTRHVCFEAQFTSSVTVLLWFTRAGQ